MSEKTAEEQTQREKTRPYRPPPQKKGGIAGMPPDSMLVFFKGKLTYTCIVGQEVASIHFDRDRREIFYRGHNIRNMAVDEPKQKLLKGLIMVLAADEQGRDFVADYAATLQRLLDDNR